MAWWRIIAGFMGLIFLGIFAAENTPDQTIAELRADPQTYIGKQVTLHIETRVDSVDVERFRVRERDATIWVRGTLAASEMGRSVSLDGIFLADQTIELQGIHTFPGRLLKVLASIPALLILIFIAIAILKINHKALEVDEHA